MNLGKKGINALLNCYELFGLLIILHRETLFRRCFNQCRFMIYTQYSHLTIKIYLRNCFLCSSLKWSFVVSESETKLRTIFLPWFSISFELRQTISLLAKGLGYVSRIFQIFSRESLRNCNMS